MKSETDRMKELEIELRYGLNGVDVEELDGYHGFVVKSRAKNGQVASSLFTVYLHQNGRHYSLFAAEDDIFKGVEIEDEKLIKECGTLARVTHEIKKAMHSMGLWGGPFCRDWDGKGAMTPSEGVRQKWEYMRG